MGLFCLLWLPLFYLFWVSVSPAGSGSGIIWALLPGSIGAVLQTVLGSPIEPHGFGFSRWAAVLVDIAILPAVLPLVVCALFALLRIIPNNSDLTGFALLWLIPGALIRAVSRSALQNPWLLILTLLIWTAIAVGIPFFLRIIAERYPSRLMFIPVLFIPALPLLAATSYWAFFSHRRTTGALVLTALCIPMGIRVIQSFRAANKRR
ncbi:MAG: hypothetical protein LBD78_08695 [Spirochaetaceae bacterium]|jgi:hypothetical protein|nr:hypothetical protein [Spirochaetaceae bacterium]